MYELLQKYKIIDNNPYIIVQSLYRDLICECKKIYNWHFINVLYWMK